MKHRNRNRILSLLLTFLLALSLLVSCASSEDGIVGTWKITKCVVNGEALVDINDCFFTFSDDGTGRKTILDEEQFTFSYSYKDGNCILYNITYPDGEVETGTYAEMTVKGDTMTVSAYEDGDTEEILLKRQK